MHPQRQLAREFVEKVARTQRHLFTRVPFRPAHGQRRRQIRRRLQLEGEQMAPGALRIDHVVQVSRLVALRRGRVPRHRDPFVFSRDELEPPSALEHRVRRPRPREHRTPGQHTGAHRPLHQLRATPAVELARHVHRLALQIEPGHQRRIEHELDHAVLRKMISRAQPEPRGRQPFQSPHAKRPPRDHENRHAPPAPVVTKLDHAPGGRLERGGDEGVCAGSHCDAKAFAGPRAAQARSPFPAPRPLRLTRRPALARPPCRSLPHPPRRSPVASRHRRFADNMPFHGFAAPPRVPAPVRHPA